VAERGIGWRDVAELVPATLRLLQAEHELRRRPVGELLAIESVARVPHPTESTPVRAGAAAPASLGPAAVMPARAALPPGTRDRTRAERIGRAVARAAKYGPVRSKCLARSLAILAWLRSAGVEGAELRIGVRRVRGEVQAHAWVVLHEVVLGDAEQHVRTFAPIAATAAAGLRW
jgi:hypothetical protein